MACMRCVNTAESLYTVEVRSTLPTAAHRIEAMKQISCGGLMMGKVVIDFEKFKECLSDYFTENLISEIIEDMNDNDVFIEDVDE